MIDAPQGEGDAVAIIADYQRDEVSAKCSSFKKELSYTRTLLCWPRSCAWPAESLPGALLDRPTHHVHILEVNGESYRLKQSKARRRREVQPVGQAAADPETAEITSDS
jgi:hypothetical protein